MQDSRELKTKDSHAMPVEKRWSKSQCSLLQMSVDVRCNVEPVVTTFVVEVAARLARWTVIGVVFYRARLVNRSNNVHKCRLSSCKTCGYVVLMRQLLEILLLGLPI